MLELIRKNTGSWVVKILLCLIILSFAVWGIGDVFRGGGVFRSIATIGDTKITYDRFSRSLRQAQTRLISAAKGKITADQIKKMGLHQKILDQLVAEALFNEEISRLNLKVPDPVIRQSIHKIFADESGTFNPEIFARIMEQAHMTEGALIEEARSQMGQQQLMAPLTMGMVLPKSYLNTLYRLLQQKYTFVVVDIPHKSMKLDKTPTVEDLKAFYDQNRQYFQLPEFRKATYLVIDSAVLKENVDVTEVQLQEAYADRKSSYFNEELRHVYQLTVGTKAQLDTAVKSIEGGRPAPLVAKDTGGQFEDLGEITKAEAPEVIMEEIFQAKVGTVGGVSSSPLGQHIFIVQKIISSSHTPFKDIREDLMDELKTEAVEIQFEALKNQVEDGISAGLTLEEVAEKQGLSFETTSFFSRGGFTPEGTFAFSEITDRALLANLVRESYQSNKGEDSSLVEVSNMLAFIVRVDDTQEAHTPALTDVKGKVRKAWSINQKFKVAGKLASEFKTEVKSEKDLSRFAKEKGLKVASLDPLNRVTATSDEGLKKRLGADVLRDMFALPKNRVAVGSIATGYVVVMMKKTEAFKPKSDAKSFLKFKNGMVRLLQDDIQNQYLAALRQRYPVDINEAQLRSAIGGAPAS